jgi:leucyl aminopeptidase
VASGLFSNDEQLTALLRQAGEVSGERVWPMPMWPEYGDLIKSHIADIKNVGGRAAGAITAAWFLRHFVQDRPWAHLDIAGTAWTESAWGELPPYLLKDAATGVGVRLLVHFVRQWTA